MPGIMSLFEDIFGSQNFTRIVTFYSFLCKDSDILMGNVFLPASAKKKTVRLDVVGKTRRAPSYFMGGFPPVITVSAFCRVTLGILRQF